MLKRNRLIACICLSSLLCPTLAAQNFGHVRRQIAEFGDGTELKLKLTDGRSFVG